MGLLNSPKMHYIHLVLRPYSIGWITHCLCLLTTHCREHTSLLCWNSFRWIQQCQMITQSMATSPLGAPTSMRDVHTYSSLVHSSLWKAWPLKLCLGFISCILAHVWGVEMSYIYSGSNPGIRVYIISWTGFRFCTNVIAFKWQKMSCLLRCLYFKCLCSTCTSKLQYIPL